MTRLPADPCLVFQDGFCRITQADFCSWPGYLILRLAGPDRALGALAAREAEALGAHLARCARALEIVTGAERVHVLSFAEVDRQLHFHLVPRTAALAEWWRREAGRGAAEPVDGPALFQWLRAVCRTEADLPPGTPRLADVLDALRGELAAP